MIDEIKAKVRKLWIDGQEPSQIAATVGAAIDDVRALLGLKVLGAEVSEVRPVPPPQEPEERPSLRQARAAAWVSQQLEERCPPRTRLCSILGVQRSNRRI